MTTDTCYDKCCKSRQTFSRKEIVLIKWNDASHQGGSSLYLSEIRPDVQLETVGFLVKETETHFSIAMEFYEKDGTWRDVTNIPKGMIVSVQRYPIKRKK